MYSGTSYFLVHNSVLKRYISFTSFYLKLKEDEGHKFLAHCLISFKSERGNLKPSHFAKCIIRNDGLGVEFDCAVWYLQPAHVYLE